MAENGNNATAATTAAATTPVRIEIKLPEFIADDPELWFSQIDRLFESAKITDELTRFGRVSGALPARYAKEVRDLIITPHATEPYTALKNELNKVLGVTQERKTQQLLEREEIGSRTPSQFLRHLKSLASTSADETIVRTLWLSRLPRTTQQILAAHKDVSLSKVAELADSIAATMPSPSVSEVQKSVSFETLLDLKIAQLKLDIHSEIGSILDKHLRESRSYERGRSPSRRRPPSRPRRHDENGVCIIHQKYGDDAYHCYIPCAYKSGNAGGSR